MKIKLKELKKLIREVMSTMGGKGRQDIDLDSPNRRYNPALDTVDVLVSASRRLFQAVAYDLGVEDEHTDEFDDYLGDKLSDYGVPKEVIKRVRLKVTGMS